MVDANIPQGFLLLSVLYIVLATVTAWDVLRDRSLPVALRWIVVGLAYWAGAVAIPVYWAWRSHRTQVRPARTVRHARRPVRDAH